LSGVALSLLAQGRILGQALGRLPGDERGARERQGPCPRDHVRLAEGCCGRPRRARRTTVRDLSARAADLTATAADKAAPYARRAGAATADASVKLAEAARGWAAELRGAKAEPDAAETYEAPSASATSTATAVAEPEIVDDVAPSGFAADEPEGAQPEVADTESFELPAETEPAPFESTADAAPANPGFEEGTGTTEEQDRPGF